MHATDPALPLPDDPAPTGFYDPAHIDLNDSVGYLMRKVMSSIRTQADAQLSALDLTYAQWLPLYKISCCPQATLASLVRETEMDPAAMTRAIDRLQAKGLVLRERSTTDRRVVQLTLTPQGQAAAASVPPVLTEVLNGHLSDFNHSEWRSLIALLHRMLANGEALRQGTGSTTTAPQPPQPDPAAEQG